MKEHLLLQLGSFSNYIGSHFWNFQLEQANSDSFYETVETYKSKLTGIDHSKLLSEVEDGELIQYIPRLVSSDYSGALGNAYCAPEDICPNEYDENSENKIEVLDSSFNKKNPCHSYVKYLNQCDNQFINPNTNDQISHNTFDFENSVLSFVDYFTPEWSPKNQFVAVPGHSYNSDTFNSFLEGYEFNFQETHFSFKEDMIDKLRHQIESSDLVESLLLLVDWCTGFGGVSCWVLEFIMDELKKVCLNLSAWNPIKYSNSETKSYKTPCWSGSLDSILSFYNLYNTIKDATAFTFFVSDFNIYPSKDTVDNAASLTFPLINQSLPYLSSALPSAAIECFTAPSRLLANLRDVDCYQMVEALKYPNPNGSLIDLKCQLPVNSSQLCNESVDIQDKLWNFTTNPPSQVTSNVSITSESFFCIRGPINQTILSKIDASNHMRYSIKKKLPVPITFPQLFFDSPNLDKDVEFTSSICYVAAKNEPSLCPVISSMNDSILKAFDANYFHSFKGSFEKETVMEVINFFKNIII